VKGLNAVPDLSENNLEERIECDKNAPVSQTLTDSEIIDAVLGRKLNKKFWKELICLLSLHYLTMLYE
jgi:hypothetical protein